MNKQNEHWKVKNRRNGLVKIFKINFVVGKLTRVRVHAGSCVSREAKTRTKVKSWFTPNSTTPVLEIFENRTFSTKSTEK